MEIEKMNIREALHYLAVIGIPTILFAIVGGILAYALLRYFESKKKSEFKGIDVEYDDTPPETPLEKEVPADEWEKDK